MGLLGLVIPALVFILLTLLYFGWYWHWETEHTAGMAYFGRSSAERALIKRRMRLYSRPVRAVVSAIAVSRRQSEMPGFQYRGVSGPPIVSSAELFARAAHYGVRPEDVFVASQMRSGTTWMLYLVYELVHRGHGQLGDTGHGNLHAVCPWIEAANGVSMDAAPLLGDRPARIVKTHLPAELCPYGERGRFIYVVRHPVACFASIQRYLKTLQGPLAPSTDRLVDWYCSDAMYWGPWPRHVSGWSASAQNRRNVLLVHYEEMVADFPGVLTQVAAFLGYDLSPAERNAISEKCSFRFMKAHEDLFEMTPPTMFSAARSGELLTGRREAAAAEVTEGARERILHYCREVLSQYPHITHRFYPDLQPGRPAA